jgi:hypothetical protein
VLFRVRMTRVAVIMWLMGTVSIVVLAPSAGEAEEWLEKLRSIGLCPLGGSTPQQVPGRESRWMLRAQPAQRGQRQDERTCTLPNDAS